MNWNAHICKTIADENNNEQREREFVYLSKPKRKFCIDLIKHTRTKKKNNNNIDIRIPFTKKEEKIYWRIDFNNNQICHCCCCYLDEEMLHQNDHHLSQL